MGDLLVVNKQHGSSTWLYLQEEHLTTHFWKSAYLHWEGYILYKYLRNERVWKFYFWKKVFSFY